MSEEREKFEALNKKLKKENEFMLEDKKRSRVLINGLKKENEIFSVENGQLKEMHEKTREEKCLLKKHHNDLNNKVVDISETLELCSVEKQELLEILKIIEVNYYELQLTTATMQRKEKTKKLKMFRF